MCESAIGKQNVIAARRALEADVEFVLAAEAVPENAQGITPWARARHLRMMEDHSVAFLIVEAKALPVGFMVFCGLDSPTQSIELRRIVITEKGQGYGRAALQLAKRMTFEEFGVHRFWLDVFTDNRRAEQLYESEGFVREGVLRDSYRVEGQYKSVVILSMLAPEYRASQR
ncbi:MAG: GNAT family protein [Acidiferrobacterales bacterium]